MLSDVCVYYVNINLVVFNFNMDLYDIWMVSYLRYVIVYLVISCLFNCEYMWFE